MSDLDITDHYQLTFDDKGVAELTLASGTLIRASLFGDAEGPCRWEFQSGPDEDHVTSETGERETRSWAEGALFDMARSLINREEPLRGPINWDNKQLVDLLQEQQRLLLCPACLGLELPCDFCDGHEWVTYERFNEWS